MKILSPILCLIFFCDGAFASHNIFTKSYTTPKEQIFYTQLFDNVCTVKTGYKINSTWVEELLNRLPRWRSLWNNEGTLLLETTTKLIDRPFTQKNFMVPLSLCSFPSMSAPLIVNARYVLQNFTNNPISDDVFISTIYHEILHSYINSFLPQKTPLLVKYKHESQGVLNHLHLFALEKAVYLKLGWKSTLDQIIEKDNNLPNKDYKRAWEIVNKDKNYEQLIIELKSFKQNKELNQLKI